MARTDDNENFTDEERQAMKDRAKETRTARSRKKKTPEEARAEGEAELRAKLDELTGSDREIGEALHALVTENAPTLVPRTYYGMPAWAKDGKVLCFFQPASKFKVRYATLASRRVRLWTRGTSGRRRSRSRRWMPPTWTSWRGWFVAQFRR